MKIMVKVTVSEESIARDYKYDVIDNDFYECDYPLEEYVADVLRENFYSIDIEISEEEIKKVIEKVQKELDKLLES